MSDREALERRLSAVERAISGGDGEIETLAASGERERRLADAEARVAAVEEAVTELEAATQALRGYVGNVRSVNRDVERRADAALAAVERLEGRRGESTDARRASGSRSAPGSRSTPGSRTGTDRHARGASEPVETTVDQVASGIEMPVPGANDGTRGGDEVDSESNGEGVLDRVRDAL